MLSRVADSLYWMSRYLERAEHTARLLGVALDQMLDQTRHSTASRWGRLLAALHVAVPGEEPLDAYAITRALTFDPASRESIASCVSMARENARQVREQISSEMWEQLNRLYLHTKEANSNRIWQGEPSAFFQSVKEGAHLFQGITDATMSHNEGWYFIQVGRSLERAGATASLLDVHFSPYLEPHPDSPAALDYNDWIGLLKSCTAFEAYCKVYTADVQPQAVAEFLLLNDECPRSIRFAADQLQLALQAIARAAGVRGGGRAERLAGRLSTGLDYGQVDEIMSENMHNYLESIRHQCSAIHGAIFETYIGYPVESALAH